MPAPKRRHSRARSRKRRTHYKAEVPTLVRCPRCNEWKRPHHVCPSCGYYRDRAVIVITTTAED